MLTNSRPIDQELTALQNPAAAARAAQEAQARAVIDAYASAHPDAVERLRVADSAAREARQRLADAEQRLQRYSSTPPVDADGVATWASARAALAGAIEGYRLLVDQTLSTHAALTDAYRAGLDRHILASLATARQEDAAALVADRVKADALRQAVVDFEDAADAARAQRRATTIVPLLAAAELLGIDARQRLA